MKRFDAQCHFVEHFEKEMIESARRLSLSREGGEKGGGGISLQFLT